MDIVKTIKKIRLEKQLTQAQVEIRAGFSESIISKIETRKRSVRVEDLAKIAKGLGVHVTDLFTWPVHYVPENSSSCRVRAVIELDLADEKRLNLIKTILHNENLI